MTETGMMRVEGSNAATRTLLESYNFCIRSIVDPDEHRFLNAYPEGYIKNQVESMSDLIIHTLLLPIQEGGFYVRYNCIECGTIAHEVIEGHIKIHIARMYCEWFRLVNEWERLKTYKFMRSTENVDAFMTIIKVGAIAATRHHHPISVTLPELNVHPEGDFYDYGSKKAWIY